MGILYRRSLGAVIFITVLYDVFGAGYNLLTVTESTTDCNPGFDSVFLLGVASTPCITEVFPFADT